MPERLARTVDPEPGSGRLRFELIFASVWLAIGLFVVPALIFWVGITLLGPYGIDAQAGAQAAAQAVAQRGGLGSFYADFFGDLASGELRTWALALGPLLIVSLVRLIFIGARPPKDDAADTPPPSAAPPSTKSTDHRRVEPRIGD